MARLEETPLSRYRLRFLLQEFDLRGPEVLIGRSGDCHITIEDPLVSRSHARILTDPAPSVEDLGSRNGVKVNGRPVTSRTELRDGDRIRIGTQELVFLVVRTRRRELRPTGFMRNCLACRTPFPEGAAECPHCGAPVEPEEDETTISGLAVEPNRSWTFQLLGDVIARAIDSHRTAEADRLLSRAAGELDAQIRQGAPLESGQIDNLGSLAIKIAVQQGQSGWVEWILDIHRQMVRCPADGVIDELESSGLVERDDVKGLLSAFVNWFGRQNPVMTPDTENQVCRLRTLAGDVSA